MQVVVRFYFVAKMNNIIPILLVFISNNVLAKDILTTSPVVIFFGLIPVILVCIYVGVILLYREIKAIMEKKKKK